MQRTTIRLLFCIKTQLGQWKTLKIYLKLLSPPKLLDKKLSSPPHSSQSEIALTPPPSSFFPSPLYINNDRSLRLANKFSSFPNLL